MNHFQMRTLLRSRCGSPSVEDVPDSNLTGHLNNAIEEILDKYPMLQGRARSKFTTTVGADKYHIDSKTNTVLKVWDRTNRIKIRKVGPSYVASNDNTGVVNGKPLYYARFANYIQLMPPPDGLYVIEFLYRVIAGILSLDGDIAGMPPAWHRGVVIYATYMYYADEGKDQQKATFAFNEFNAWVKTKPIEMQEELTDMDQGIELPSLSDGGETRLDFDHSS